MLLIDTKRFQSTLNLEHILRNGSHERNSTDVLFLTIASELYFQNNGTQEFINSSRQRLFVVIVGNDGSSGIVAVISSEFIPPVHPGLPNLVCKLRTNSEVCIFKTPRRQKILHEIHSFIQEVFFGCSLHARHCVR